MAGHAREHRPGHRVPADQRAGARRRHQPHRAARRRDARRPAHRRRQRIGLGQLAVRRGGLRPVDGRLRAQLAVARRPLRASAHGSGQADRRRRDAPAVRRRDVRRGAGEGVRAPRRRQGPAVRRGQPGAAARRSRRPHRADPQPVDVRAAPARRGPRRGPQPARAHLARDVRPRARTQRHAHVLAGAAVPRRSRTDAAHAHDQAPVAGGPARRPAPAQRAWPGRTSTSSAAGAAWSRWRARTATSTVARSPRSGSSTPALLRSGQADREAFAPLRDILVEAATGLRRTP